jgi:two-component system CheB/CheR fusion protein
MTSLLQSNIHKINLNPDNAWLDKADFSSELLLSSKRASHLLCHRDAIEGYGGVWEWNIKTDEMFWSPSFCKILSVFNFEERKTFQQFCDMIHPDDIDDFKILLDAHLQRDFDLNIELRLFNSEKKIIWINLAGKVQRDQYERPIYMFGNIQDITLHKKTLDHLTQTNQSLERFAYICSHDLKEPARLVDNLLTVFMEDHGGELNEDAVYLIHRIQSSAKRLQTMIQDILDYSRIQQKHIQWEIFPCEEEVNKALENLSLSIKEHQACLTVHPLPVIKADRPHIFHIFQNLISNAIKFGHPDNPKIDISCQEEGQFWHFKVSDNGIGIAEQHRTRIFDVFERLHREDEYEGNGIGLTICQKIVEKHKGKIWVTSNEGRGSTFHFTLLKK